MVTSTRIQELLKTCTDAETQKPWPLVNTDQFALLLIQECANIAAQRGDKQMASEIYNHFGLQDATPAWYKTQEDVTTLSFRAAFADIPSVANMEIPALDKDGNIKDL